MIVKLIILILLALICFALYFITKDKTRHPVANKTPIKRFKPSMLKFKIKLNVQSIMEYERLTHKSFIDFIDSSKSNESDILPLLYCMLAANNNDFNQTYDDAMKYLFTNNELMERLSKRLDDELKFVTQFGNLDFLVSKDDISIDGDKGKNKGERQTIYYSQFIPPLISECGLDINYVLYQMPFTDVDLYMKYRDERKKEDLEEKRLFTYTIISPHIDNRKLTYEKFMVFPWEKARKHKESVEYLNNKDNQDKLKTFLKSKPIII